MNPSTTSESERILREYDRREREIPDDFYALHHPANLFIRHGHETAILWGLARAGLVPLDGRRVLEIGCGTGQWFDLFLQFGAAPADIAGVDLSAARIAAAKTRCPAADLQVGDAAQLPWPDATFDVVFQSTVMTSILSTDVRRRVAAEMLRVVKPRGALLWLDFFYNNPRNPNVRGVGKRELNELFAGYRIERRRVTLAPPIARRLVPWSRRLAQLLEMTTLLNTHYLAVIRRTS